MPSRGRLASFRRAIAGRYVAGRLTNAEASALAVASLEHLSKSLGPGMRHDCANLRPAPVISTKCSNAARAGTTRWLAKRGCCNRVWVRWTRALWMRTPTTPTELAAIASRLDPSDDFAKIREALERDSSPVVRRAAVRVLAKAKASERGRAH